MLKPLFRRHWLVIVVVVLVIAGLALFTLLARDWQALHESTRPAAAAGAGAPPDLERLREPFTAGLEALQQNDGAEAVRQFTSFDFGSRPVEEYRLYYLANGYQLMGSTPAARHTLARLWRRSPRLVYAEDAAFNLASLYAAEGDQRHAATVYASLARRADVPAVAAAARWRAATARLVTGDLAGAVHSARSIVISHPRTPEAKEAEALLRAITGVPAGRPVPLTPSERFDRALALVSSGGAEQASRELEALAAVAPQMRADIALQRGLALQRLGRLADSNTILETLTSGAYKQAIPALRATAKNYSVLGAAINPIVQKTVKERKRVGTQKVRVGKGKKRKTVTRPRYQTVFRKVELVDLEKKKKKEEYERLASERLKDLLSLPIDDGVRLETLNALIARALEKKQTPYLRELVPQVIALDPASDPALQHFWDTAWAAYQKGDLRTARDLMQFIHSTYRHVNVKRQAEYWQARSMERLGEEEEAEAIYRRLAAAPYVDLYAAHAISRGAPRPEAHRNPLDRKGNEWRDLAEKEMPEELQLAWELTSLLATREAYVEIRRNQNPKNVRFAEALLAEYHHLAGNDVLMYRSLRKAWPQLATVDQDSVPEHFLRMYYPLEHGALIEEHARNRKLDPNLVRAIILQESYYNPKARSRVGATGLMQLMPATAAEHARRLRIAFAASRLENPEVNIELGTYHLAMLMRLFDGNRYYAVAAYNAGQGNVAKWRREMKGKPVDEILESIPYSETRNYVKRVTLLNSAYSRLTM